MKKILTAALSVLLIVSLIGCGGKEKADDKTASNSDKSSYWSELEVSADALCNKYLSPDTKNKVSKIIWMNIIYSELLGYMELVEIIL